MFGFSAFSQRRQIQHEGVGSTYTEGVACNVRAEDISSVRKLLHLSESDLETLEKSTDPKPNSDTPKPLERHGARCMSHSGNLYCNSVIPRKPLRGSTF